jgi:hypothetical protein
MTRAGWMAYGAAAAAVLAVFAVMSQLGKGPGEEPPFVVVSRAASTPPHARAFAPRASGTTRDLHALAASGAHLYAAGAGGVLLHLDDPRRGFVALASGTERDLFALHVSRVAAIAVGGGGAIVRAQPDGAWSAATSGVTADLFGVAADEATREIVAVGAEGTIVHTTGGAWSAETSGATQSLRGVTFAAGAAYAVGDGGTIVVRAAPGARWTRETSGTTRDLLAIGALGGAGGGATLIAVGAAGTILRRVVERGARPEWIASPALVPGDLRAIRAAERAFYAVGRGGAVVRVDATGVADVAERPASTTTTDLDGVAVRLGEVYVAGAGGLVLARELF